MITLMNALRLITRKMKRKMMTTTLATLSEVIKQTPMEMKITSSRFALDSEFVRAGLSKTTRARSRTLLSQMQGTKSMDQNVRIITKRLFQ